MAVSERELKITLRALIGDFVNPLKTAKAEIVGFGEAVEGTFERIEEKSEHIKGVWKGMLEAFVGIEIVEQLIKIAEGANQANDALEIAANTAKNFGKAFDASAMEKFIEQLAASAQGGGFAINQLRDSIQQLATVNATGAQMQRLLADATGLAATKHISLAEATHLVVEAATGHVAVLGRYGIAVEDANGKTLSFTQVMKNLESEIMGNAQKRAEGLEGAFGRLAAAGNALVTGPFGQTLVTIFIAGANAAAAFLTSIAQLPAPLLSVAAALAAGIASLTALGLMLPAVKLGFEFMANGVGLAMGAVRGLFLVVASMIPELAGLRDILLATDLAAALLEAPFIAIGLAIVALTAGIAEIVRGFSDLKNLWSWFLSTDIGKMLFPKLPEFKLPPTSLDGLGGPDKGAQKAIDDWLTAQKAAIMKAVTAATEATDLAAARLTAASARLTELRDKRDPTKPLTAGNVAEEERLITAELQREREVRAAIANQQKVEITAASQLKALAAAIPAADKDRVQHAAQIRSEAEKHVIAAIKLGGEYDKLGGTLAKMARDAADVARSFARQVAELAKISADKLKESFAIGWAASVSHARSLFDQGNVRPANGPLETGQRRIASAQFDYTAAVNEARHAEEIAETVKAAAALQYLIAATQDATTAAKTRADADIAVQQATANVTIALDDLHLATKRLKEVKVEEHNATLKTILDRTAGQIPGVSVGATGALSFSPAAVFAEAIAQSKSFADIMQFVNELMSVFSGIVDALEPVIDALLKVVATLVNGFIALWNTIVRLIGILGIHLQQLQYINTNFGPASTQMITFVHDIPTLNELASGNIGPLTTNPSNSPLGQIHQDLLNLDSHQGNWFTNLLEGIALLVGIDFLTNGHFFQGISQFFSGLFGGGGGAGGILGGSGSGGSGGGGLGAFLGGTKIGGATLGSTLLAVGGGALEGSLLNKLIGGNSGNGAIGGAIGGGLGATLGLFGMAAGPLGALAGATLGSLLGGLFGPKYSAAKNPDFMGDTASYNQAVANFNGATQQNSGGVNGVFEDQNTSNLTGGTGVLKLLSDYIAKTGGAGLSQAMISEFANDQGGITSLHEGKWTLGNGTIAPWQQVVTDAQSAIQQITTALQAATAPASSGSLSPPDSASVGSLTTNVNIYGDVHGYNDVEQLGADLAQSQIATINSRRYTFGNVA